MKYRSILVHCMQTRLAKRELQPRILFMPGTILFMSFFSSKMDSTLKTASDLDLNNSGILSCGIDSKNR